MNYQRYIATTFAILLVFCGLQGKVHGQQNKNPITITVPMDERVEGVVALHPTSGELRCFVLGPRVLNGYTGFFKKNIVKDIGKNAKSRYALAKSTVETEKGFASTILYVCDLSSGNLAAYRIPWNKVLGELGRPQIGKISALKVWKSPIGANISIAAGSVYDDTTAVFLFSHQSGMLQAFALDGKRKKILGTCKRDLTKDLKEAGINASNSNLIVGRVVPFGPKRNVVPAESLVHISGNNALITCGFEWNRRAAKLGIVQNSRFLPVAGSKLTK